MDLFDQKEKLVFISLQVFNPHGSCFR